MSKMSQLAAGLHEVSRGNRIMDEKERAYTMAANRNENNNRAKRPTKTKK